MMVFVAALLFHSSSMTLILLLRGTPFYYNHRSGHAVFQLTKQPDAIANCSSRSFLWIGDGILDGFLFFLQ
jgi:hypothetical protein